MKLKTKLFIILFIMMAVFIIVGVLSLLLINNYGRIQDLSYFSQETYINMLQCRRDEKDFFLRLDKKYISSFKEEVNKVKKNLDNLTKLTLEEDDQQTLKDIKNLIDKYSTMFLQTAILYEEKGLDEESGLYGTLRNSIHKLEDELNYKLVETGDKDKKLGYNEIMISMLLLRRHEKDFMLRKDTKYIDRFNKEITKIKQLINSNIINSSSTLTFINNYKRDFMAYVDKELEIENKISEFRNIVHEVENNLNGYIDLLREDIKNINKQTSVLTIGLIIAFIIMAIIIITALIVANIKFNNIEKIVIMFNEISKGKILKEKLFSKSNKDEIDQLVKSFNILNEFMIKRNEVLAKIAYGNISMNVQLASDEDEVGIALNEMLDKLNEIIMQINVAVNQITEGAYQISNSTQSLSQGSSEQASSIEEISSSINEINSQIQTNTQNTIKTNKLSENTKESVEKGSRQMQQLVSAMNNVNKSASDIKNIVKVIDDIAFQTNLLALNADIEAARVGKYGKGFAVVANSVRNLALKSQNSVKETTYIVDDVVKNIKDGSILVNQTSDQLEIINENVIKVFNISNEVSKASQEQSKGIEQISIGLSQIEDIVQSNSANAEENAAASEQLSSQSEKLKDLVSYFKIRDNKLISKEVNV